MSDDARTATLWRLGDFAEGRGLEIGPLHSPIVPRERADVHYVDVLSTEDLRAYYAGDDGVDKSKIPHVDFVLIDADGKQRSLAEVTADVEKFDWVMASHVIEHVADLAGWLMDVAEAVRDDGALVLAVPDGRFTFDVLRPVTTVGQVLEAHERGDTRPGVRAVHDHFSSVVDIDVAGLWDGKPPPSLLDQPRTREGIAAQVEKSRTGYVDVHVWVLTPDSLLATLDELRRLGLCPWYVEVLEPTAYHSHEFYVRLRRLPRGADPDAAVPGEVLPGDATPDWLRHTPGDGTRVSHLERRVRRLRRRVRQQEREIAAVKASPRWRLGGLLTAPARVVRRRR